MTLRICARCKAEYPSRVPNQPVTTAAIRADIKARRYFPVHGEQGPTAVGRSFEFCCPRCRANGAPELRR